MKKIRVGLLFGGRSGEHEVSLASAKSVLEALDKEKYEAVPIGITRQGHWLISDSPEALLQREVTLELPGTAEAVPDITHHGIVRVNDHGGIDLHQTAVDVVFPLLHGPYGEDGTVQGLLELADIPYVGAGVLGSAVSMDKAMMKDVFAHRGLPVVPYQLVRKSRWDSHREEVLEDLQGTLAFPMFVKPCNLGSSVGISKAHDAGELEHSLDVAARYDGRIIVEQGIDAREVECSVLGNDEPMVSLPGEVVSHHEYYDYESKYTDGLADFVIPAKLTPEQTRTLQEYARKTFLAVNASGMARVDFFVRKGRETGNAGQSSPGALGEDDTSMSVTDGEEILVNEINTIPGFTSTSMYPKLWEASGVAWSEVIDRLIQLAFDRHVEKGNRSTRL